MMGAFTLATSRWSSRSSVGQTTIASQVCDSVSGVSVPLPASGGVLRSFASAPGLPPSPGPNTPAIQGGCELHANAVLGVMVKGRESNMPTGSEHPPGLEKARSV